MNMTWTDSIRNSKSTVNGVTYRAHNNMLVVSEFGSQKRYPAVSRSAAQAHAELIAKGVI